MVRRSERHHRLYRSSVLPSLPARIKWTNVSVDLDRSESRRDSALLVEKSWP